MLKYCILLCCSILLTWIVRFIALRKSLLDIPNDRSAHKTPTPRGGGIAIVIVWFGFLIYIEVFGADVSSDLMLALFCGFPIALIGLFDDIFTVSPFLRLLVQVISTILAVFFLGGIPSVDLGFTILHSSYLFSILAVIGVVWFTNLFNFLDGIDGYLSVEIIFICLGAFLLLGFELPIFLAVTTLGFLLWNWQPAKIFMGDVGSTLLGFTVGILAIYYQNTNQSSIVIWLMLTSLFWFDATITLFRRWRNHEHLSDAHKKHAFQRIVQSGFSHKKTVLYSLAINISILGMIRFALIFPNMILIFFFINMVYLYIITRLIDNRFAFNKNK